MRELLVHDQAGALAAGSAGLKALALVGPGRFGSSIALVVLIAVGACAPNPQRLRAERTIDVAYDRENGRLELITFDSDDNGIVDTWSHMDGRVVRRIEIDSDEDGSIDRWEYYAEDRTLERVGLSSAGDGTADAWMFAGEDGEMTRVEFSTAGNGHVDRWEFYEAWLRVRAEEDLDLDGRPDKWESYEAGMVSAAAFDEDDDGRPDRRLIYADGVLETIEADPDEHGVYRSRVEVGR